MLNENEIINHPSPNYSPGRGGTPIRHITFHHVAGTAASALARFDNPAEQVSAHFVVGKDYIWCCVNTDDTAWTNGVWAGNLEAVTIEHEGTWLNGYRNDAVINNSARLVAWLRTLYPNATPNRHRDYIATACPGELPVEEIWSKASALLKPKPAPAPTPTPTPTPAPTLKATDIPNKQMKVSKKGGCELWDLHFTKWADAKSVKHLDMNTLIEVSAIAEHPLGGKYYLTEYSYSKGIWNGINVNDLQDVVLPPLPAPTPPPPNPDISEADKNVIRQFIDWLKAKFKL